MPPTLNELAAHDAALSAAKPKGVVKGEVQWSYNVTLQAYRSDYRKCYKLALGDPVWDAQLEDGFIKGIATTPRTLHLAAAGLNADEAYAHIVTSDILKTRKQSLTQLYDHYLLACDDHVKTYNEAYTTTLEDLEKQHAEDK